MSKLGEVLFEIIELLQEGASPDDVAQILDIPLDWVVPAYRYLMDGEPYEDGV
jgi:hypothetical protein